MLNKKEIEDVLKLKGDVRGAVFKTDARYVLEKKGEEELKKIETRIFKETGEPVKYGKEVISTNWYPLSWRILSLLFIKDTFKWDDEEIFKMGLTAPKYSFIVKTLLSYFVSLEKTFAESTKYWREHYSTGELFSPTIDVKGKLLVIQLKDFESHPILCPYFKGFFKSIANLSVRTKKMNIEEDKCVFRGDEYHQFVITWE